MWSGGSIASASLIWVALTVTVQTVAFGRSDVGSSVIVLVPLPLTEKVCGLLSHEIVNELVVTSTGSLKSTVMFAVGSTLLAPLSGVVAVTIGAESVVNENG